MRFRWLRLAGQAGRAGGGGGKGSHRARQTHISGGVMSFAALPNSDLAKGRTASQIPARSSDGNMLGTSPEFSMLLMSSTMPEG